ncbi:PREDICTED: zinc finger A20 and AN1 domain-containing stress-associated protein 3 [Fragaria vesca subsp. vesca]|uniref:zinc finger A20 and AN1 domain-containing stress-associated protein 3 n=1 Tax=Fragaria vesca subsp. vesca TaxID=101020 RepID=UPI0002C30EF9|nr:PREDICTED: zinc finger A20 and AN1 domain-containing stress-associated protein 3 [Fragaria vesca subsp. vesca]
MAEEHRCQAQKLCVNNCGFFGSPTTQNLCSKCYRDLQHKEQQALSLNQTIISAAAAAATSSSSSAFFPSSPVSVATQQSERVVVDAKVEEEEKKEEVAAVPAAASQANRCMACKRRVGLTGFKCRCGMTFCGTHRYPEQHACGFDFRSMGREQIAKANPVIRGEKLQRI